MNGFMAVDIETAKIKNVCPQCGNSYHFIPPNDPLPSALMGVIVRCPGCDTLALSEDLDMSRDPVEIIAVDFCWRHEDGMTIEHKFFGDPGDFLSTETIFEIRQFISEAQAEGFVFTGINLVGFDFKHLYFAGAFEDILSVIGDTFDPMLIAVCEFGYPIGLDALGFPLGLNKLTEFDGVKVNGANACDLWMSGYTNAVIAYVQQDTYQSLVIAETTLPGRVFTWRNSKGGISTKTFRSRTTSQALSRPQPDTSWMDAAPVVTRKDLTYWIPSAEMVDDIPF